MQRCDNCGARTSGDICTAAIDDRGTECGHPRRRVTLDEAHDLRKMRHDRDAAERDHAHDLLEAQADNHEPHPRVYYCNGPGQPVVECRTMQQFADAQRGGRPPRHLARAS